MCSPAARIAAGTLAVFCGVCLLGAKSASAELEADVDRARLDQLVEELEKARAAYEAALQRQEALEKRVEELEKANAAQAAAGSEPPAGPGTVHAVEPAAASPRSQRQLEQRVRELEARSLASESATRQIILDSLSTLGAQINEYVTFGGTLEIFSGWLQDFNWSDDNILALGTAQIDFEIAVNSWTLGSVVFEYDDGTSNVFTTVDNLEVSIDRINVDTAYLTVGDTTRFWPFLSVGRMIVPFGISTGQPVADVLTLEDPLTIEAFEARQDALLLGVEFPTPALEPPTRIPTPPPVRPVLLAPFVGRLARLAGYRPIPAPPPPPSLMVLPPDPPPFYAGVYLYQGQTFDAGPRRGWNPANHIGATAGYRTFGKCRPYRELGEEATLRWLHFLCPFKVEYDVDYNASVFDSRFLEFEYSAFLREIAFVPGMAASIKGELGPIAVVLEWNGALGDAKFYDARRRFIRIRPSAWQISLGYQFDWNPTVPRIGAQGTYVTVGYSESRELGGVLYDSGGANDPADFIRVGNVPERRLLVGLGEWVADGLRVSVEYSFRMDYPKDPNGLGVGTGKTGTGISAHGFLSGFTYEW